MVHYKKAEIAVFVTALALFLAGAPVFLFAGVSDTKHNLAYWSGNTFRSADETQVCKFCHTPHNASPDTPLWGHALSTESFAMYSSATLVIDDPDVLGDSEYKSGLTGTSKLCMGCHDGVTSLGALVNANISMDTYDTLAGRTSEYKNLRNKHPVSFKYNATVLTWINGRKGSASSYYDLPPDTTNGSIVNEQVERKWNQEGQRVECNICHDPHEDKDGNASQNPFWISSSVGGYSAHDSVCVTCHKGTFGEFTGFVEYTSFNKFYP